jgi:hypothetical protein
LVLVDVDFFVVDVDLVVLVEPHAANTNVLPTITAPAALATLPLNTFIRPPQIKNP